MQVPSSMVTDILSYGYPATSTLLSHECSRSSVEVVCLGRPSSSLIRTLHFHLSCSASYWGRPALIKRRKAWLVRSNVDSSRGLGSSFTSDSSNTTRLIRAIKGLQVKLNARIMGWRTNLPMKLLLLLIGFYSATAFATVIGQTGDWDVLSAVLAVTVVEGIGALMYKTFFPFVQTMKDLITMLNYWKTGLTLGLFLDSFKY